MTVRRGDRQLSGGSESSMANAIPLRQTDGNDSFTNSSV
jgi:hypothetical protein